MKKIVLIAAFILIAGQVFAQRQGTGIEIAQNTITVLVDSSDAKSVWYGFPGTGGGIMGFSEIAIDTKDRVFNSGDLVLMGKLTVSSGSEASDSLQAYAIPLGPDGFVMGEDTLWFDFDDHTTSTTELSAANGGYLNWSAFSGTLGVTTYTFWINLTNKYPPAWGMKYVFNNHDGDDSGSGTMISSLELLTGEVR